MSDPAVSRDDLLADIGSAPAPELEAVLIAARFLPFRPLERVALLRHAPTAQELFAMDHYAVERCIGRPLRKTAWDPKRLYRETEIDRRWLSMPDRRVWWIGDGDYPQHLRGIWDPPAVLFGWGDPRGLRYRGVAVVGTREPDDAGRAAAYGLGIDLGSQGVVVVSGLARGIDVAAHRGAIVTETPATAVLGSGVDAVFPRENRSLAADLLDAGGIVVSEYPPGTPAHRMRFPARNRIVVGLSAGVVVVQAPERSGALISADYGLQNGLEVMVHRAGALWTGCRRLIAEGAATIETARDVLALVAPEQIGSAQTGAAGGADDIEAVYREANARKLALFDPDPEVTR